jgi:MFS family permease
MEARRHSYLLLLLIYAGFISLGLPDGTLGVAWPTLHVELHLPLGLAGSLMTVIMLLSGLSGFASGNVIARWGTGRVVLLSCALTGSALLALGLAPGLIWLLAAAVPLGLGGGAVDAGLNGFVARHYSGRHMNWLHACWGIGASTGPLIMGYALAAGPGWRGGYMVIGSIQLALAALFLLSLRLWSRVPELRSPVTGEGIQPRQPALGANSFAGWLSAVIFALYVAVELTAGLWAASILVLDRGFSSATAAVGTAVYYGAITGGRILIGFEVERWGNRRLVAGTLPVALVGAVLFALSGAPVGAIAALGLLGLGFAPVYPCLMHEVPRRFAPAAVQTVIGRQSGAANIGGAILPAAAGYLAQQSLPGICWVIVGGIVALFSAIRLLDRAT